jgi:plasmid stabilization system protein ParE
MKLRYDSRARFDIDEIYHHIAEHDPTAAARA